jgi:AcrR family transcriptional regulator
MALYAALMPRRRPLRSRARTRARPRSASASASAFAVAASAPRARLDVDARRAQLVTLALDAFGERSYDDVSIDEFARAAGISKGLVFHYFPTKRDLYVAALRRAAQLLIDATAPDPSAPQDEQLRRSLEAYLDFVERHARSYVALIRGGVGFDPTTAAIVEDTRSQLVSRIHAGLPRAPSSSLRRAALRGWIGFVEAMVTDWISYRGLSRAQLLELLAAALFDAVHRATELGTRGRR